MVDTIIANATVITMDAERRVIDDGAVAIEGDRVSAVGRTDEVTSERPELQVLDATHSAVMPGMVDLHGKVGHATLRSLGEHLSGPTFRRMWDEVALRHATERWYYVDALLGAAEKLRNGCTAVVTQPGAAQARMGDLRYVRQVHKAMEDLGIRARIIAGIGRAPWPQEHADEVDGKWVSRAVTFEESLENIEAVIAENSRNLGRLVDYCTGSARIGNPNPADPMYVPQQDSYVRLQAERLREIMDRYDVGFFTNAYGNSVEYSYDEGLGLLGPKTIVSHGNGLGDRAVKILAETGTSVSHNPLTRRLYEYGQDCTVVEMLEAGVVVGLGSDGPAPDRSGDPLATARAAMRHQRERFASHAVLPPGKALEMITVDGHRALGRGEQVGSLEVGMKADLVVIDMFKPHLWPTVTPVQQAAYFASGADVRHVFVDGRHVVVEGRISTINEEALLAEAFEELQRLLAIDELGLDEIATIGPGFGQARRPGAEDLRARNAK